MAPPPLFSKLKFYVMPVNPLDIPRRAELIALLKAHGGEAVPRLEALSLGAAVMRLVVDAFLVPDKDVGVDFYDAQWAFASASKGALLDREPYRLKPRTAVPEATGAKRKYLRYTLEDDAALRAFVAARPGLKATGLKIWQQAFEQQITQHSVWSMKERYATLLSKGMAEAAPLSRPVAAAEEEEPEERPAKAAKVMPPRRRAAADDAPAAPAAEAAKRSVVAEAPPQPPPVAAPEPLARALAPQSRAPVYAYTTVVEAEEVDARVSALMQKHMEGRGSVVHALVTTAGDFDDADAFLRMSRGKRELEVARGWSSADDRVLQAAARDPAPPGAPLPTALRGRTQLQVENRCHFLGCVVPRPFVRA